MLSFLWGNYLGMEWLDLWGCLTQVISECFCISPNNDVEHPCWCLLAISRSSLEKYLINQMCTSFPTFSEFIYMFIAEVWMFVSPLKISDVEIQTPKVMVLVGGDFPWFLWSWGWIRFFWRLWTFSSIFFSKRFYVFTCACSVTKSCPTLWPHGL